MNSSSNEAPGADYRRNFEHFTNLIANLHERLASVDNSMIDATLSRPTAPVTRSATRRTKSNQTSSPISSSEPKSLALRTQLKTYKSFATIIVGSSRTEFFLHKDLLTSCSPFFAAALSGPFVESHTQTVTLPEEPLSSFEYFAQWLYTRSLAHDTTNARGQPTYFVLLDLYALADRLCVEALRNDVCDRIGHLAETTNSVPTPSDTWILCERIRDGAPVRRLVADLFAFKKTDNLLETHEDEWHPLFLKALVVLLKRPQRQAVARHALAEWRVVKGEHAGGAAACDVCRLVCRANGGHWRCEECARVLCQACVARGLGGCGWDWPREGACKPWLRDACQYHEHGLTPRCREEKERVGERLMARLG